MPPSEKRVNQRYCKLLCETFEKYKDIDLIPSKIKADDKGKQDMLNETGKKVCPETHNLGPKSERKACKYKVKTNFYTKKQFSTEEDEFILKSFYKKGYGIETIKFVCEKLSRCDKSIRGRYEILSRRNIGPKRSFTLEEDMLIIDEAVRTLKKGISLRDVKITNCGRDLETSLNRAYRSIFDRWKRQLHPWILQYYKKTLNFEIRPMLANVIADNFDSISSVNWGYVSSFPEFSGYTEKSLRALYGNQVIRLVEDSTGVGRTKLSLKEIASVAEEKFKNIKIRKGIIKRQTEVINYFEKCVEENNLVIDI